MLGVGVGVCGLVLTSTGVSSVLAGVNLVILLQCNSLLESQIACVSIRSMLVSLAGYLGTMGT